MEENPKQETESAKSDARKIGLRVVLGAGKEEGGLALGSVGHVADTSQPPYLTSSVCIQLPGPVCLCLRAFFRCRRLTSMHGRAEASHARGITPVPPAALTSDEGNGRRSTASFLVLCVVP